MDHLPPWPHSHIDILSFSRPDSPSIYRLKFYIRPTSIVAGHKCYSCPYSKSEGNIKPMLKIAGEASHIGLHAD
jgi:hypothetical protein